MNSKRKKRQKADAIRRAHRAARDERGEDRLHKARLGPAVGGRHYPATAPSAAPGIEVSLPVPTKFCFLSDPNAALQFLDQVRDSLARTGLRKLTFDFSKCSILGLCAYSILHTTISDARDDRWHTPLAVFAVPSETPAVNQMLSAPENALGPKPVNLFRSPMIRGKAINNQFSKNRDKAGTEIVDYLTRCLATEETELTREGRKYIGNLITEAVGNAEEHSGPWGAAGYFVQQYTADPGECHLVLFNSGATISERIESPTSSPEIRERAVQLADSHLRRGFFTAGLMNDWNKEALVTLYALQEGVSSRLHERASRGNGTVQMIKAFSELAGTDQRMCILSGSAYILFDGTYGLSLQKTTDTESREVIAFNREMDLELRPDDKYVKALPGRFEGTIVSVRFRLARGQVTELTKKRSGQ